MRDDEPQTTGGDKRPRRRDRFEFYYYERVGDRYYLRITRFSLYLMVVVGVAVLIISSLESRGGRPHDVDLKVGTPDSTPYPTQSLELKPPPTFAPPAGRGTGAGMPARRRSPSPTPPPTPSATLVETPRPDPTRPPSPPGPAP